MIICHATNSLTRTGGGTPHVVWGLSRGHARAGHETRVIGLSDPYDDEWLDDARLSHIDTEVHPRAGPYMLGWSRLLHKRLVCSEYGKEIDLLHQHGIWSMLSYTCHRWSKRWHKPKVITVHGMLDGPRLQHKPMRKRAFAAIAENRNLRSAAVLHALCESEHSDIRQFGLDNPTAVIPNGISVEDYADLPSEAQLKELQPQLRDRRILLYLGRLHPLKGLPALVEAWRECKAERNNGWTLAIIGPDQAGTSKSLRDYCRQHKLTEGVALLGPMYGADKLAALAAASCFILPSHTEGFAISVLEAMACSLPVIITPACNFPEIALEQAGWVTTPEPSLLSAQIKATLNLSAAQLRETGRRGRNLVERKYSWQSIATDMTAVYQWAVSGSSIPSSIDFRD